MAASGNRGWLLVVTLLSLLCVGLIIGLVVIGLDRADLKEQMSNHASSSASSLKSDDNWRTTPSTPSVFDTFSEAELKEIKDFMHGQSQLNLVPITEATLSSNYIFLIDPLLPPKDDVVSHLSGDSPAPDRRARVTVFKGASDPPVVEEYVVSPVPNVQRMAKLDNSAQSKTIPWNSRPMDPVEMTALQTFIKPVMATLRPLLEQSYGYWHGDDCGEKCLKIAYIPRGVSAGDRKAIVWFFRDDREGYYVWPISLRMLIDCNTNDPSQFSVDSVFYEGNRYETADALIDDYVTSGRRPIRKYASPPGGATHGSPEARGPKATEKRPPTQADPDGKRFKVDGQHVKYMDWEFNFRLRTVNGLQLMDVRFRGERIAYEISMSDVAVLYSGDAPEGTLVQYVDAGFSLGALHMPVMKGYDCPDNAVYFNNTFFDSVSGQPKTHVDALCLFEHNTGVPVRRHHSMNFFPLQPDTEDPYYYRFSMVGTVLTLRGIATVWNYDYVFDYIFHPNGVMETKVSSTGYIQSFTSKNDDKYGLYINRDFGITGNLHHHIFNYKYDFDIGGRENKFESWDLKLDNSQQNELLPTPNTQMKQRYMQTNVRRTEKEALVDYNFDEPKYYVVFNDKVNNSNGYPRAYRIYSPNFSKKLIPDKWYYEEGFSWARHQLVVTRYKDDEDTSATLWTQGDPYRPVRKFSDFYEDDEDIVDKDLVAWACIGLHHIPVAEDVPVTTTPGKALSITIAPLNFFNEDPSMASGDTVVYRYPDEL